MSPARVKEGDPRGYIVPIGGAERKIGDEAILKRFASLAGGRGARLARSGWRAGTPLAPQL